jgi:glycosyltransferase involved in cell wall biosynthesis
VVCSNRTSLPEVVGDAGILVDPVNPREMAEETLSVLRDRERARRLGEKGIRRAREFASGKYAETLYRYILSCAG